MRGVWAIGRPWIGLTCELWDRDVEGVQVSYARCVDEAGGCPVLLPSGGGFEAELLDRMDGLLLTGGGDPDPRLYGEMPHPMLGRVSGRRDRMELFLLKEARRRRLPVLGICRGMQMMAVAQSGRLIQDLPSQVARAHGHRQKAPRGTSSHAVRLLAGSELCRIVGKGVLWVNSFHHQAVAEPVPPGLVACGHSEDGMVEALEDPSLPFFIGVEWHPESMEDAGESAALFRAFVQSAGRPEKAG